MSHEICHGVRTYFKLELTKTSRISQPNLWKPSALYFHVGVFDEQPIMSLLAKAKAFHDRFFESTAEMKYGPCQARSESNMPLKVPIRRGTGTAPHFSASSTSNSFSTFQTKAVRWTGFLPLWESITPSRTMLRSNVRMIQQRDVQGRIYSFKSTSEYLDSGVQIPDIPDAVKLHMVLVLDLVPGKHQLLKVMIITTTSAVDGEYVPISPTPKKGYAIQLRLRSHTVWHHGAAVTRYPSLGTDSYLKIDEHYEVPIQMLREVTDRAGNPFMIYPKRQGGVAQLRHHVLHCNETRKTAKFAIGSENERVGEVEI
ncbi:uncharacterized protein LY89DRAFT_351180 [Mollisia scopiformis]|uniref:Uncharacterized protein n=1 Tax=Mollisia scopiformis TaxID=149040 RepID=A0A132B5I8_MOLSC|nr:uncharacterized protein LY89DRAFT_351180 [Mollisia scopiformis]KUJ07675.1 hypothetical protein LY89DRAFT_351180 [Mollisia scopiformis]